MVVKNVVWKKLAMCIAGITVSAMMLSACGQDVRPTVVETTENVVETTVVETVSEETEAKETTAVAVEETESSNPTNAEGSDSVTKEESTVEVIEATAAAETTPMVFDSSNYEAVDETVYANDLVNVRKGPSTDYERVGSLSYGESVHRTGIGADGWSRVEYDGETCYVFSEYLQTEEPAVGYTGSYPMTYSDGGVNITIYKEWYGDSNVYAAHVVMSDYSRFRGEYLGGQYLSSAANGVVLAINGDWASPNGYTEIRGGNVICETNVPEGAYSADTGELWYAQRGYSGATETFCFGPAFLIDGSICNTGSGGAAQRTFIGTNGTPGDLWLVVSDGRGFGGSVGLSPYECAAYLQSKGCTFGVPLDGGGSTEMIFQGQILNAIDGERALNDALYITY